MLVTRTRDAKVSDDIPLRENNHFIVYGCFHCYTQPQVTFVEMQVSALIKQRLKRNLLTYKVSKLRQEFIHLLKTQFLKFYKLKKAGKIKYNIKLAGINQLSKYKDKTRTGNTKRKTLTVS